MKRTNPAAPTAPGWMLLAVRTTSTGLGVPTGKRMSGLAAMLPVGVAGAAIPPTLAMARVAALAKMVLLPTWQSWATCAWVMNRLRSPTTVREPPWAVPRLIVVNSRMVLPAPISSEVGSPAYLRSCGGVPMAAWAMMCCMVVGVTTDYWVVRESIPCTVELVMIVWMMAAAVAVRI